ncbi:MAG: transglycosylase domain-containing protein [Chloroflexota bacterium]
MNERPIPPSEEEPSDHFRRLLSEAERAEQDTQDLVSPEAKEGEQHPSGDPSHSSRDAWDKDERALSEGEGREGKIPGSKAEFGESDSDEGLVSGHEPPEPPDDWEEYDSRKKGVSSGLSLPEDEPLKPGIQRGAVRGGEEHTLPLEQANVPSPPLLGRTPPSAPPAIDTEGMPLPRRVDEIDVDSTMVSQVAYGRTTPSKPLLYSPPPESDYAPPKPRPVWGCLLRGFIVVLFGFVLLGLIGGSFALYEYYTIAATLPNIDDLPARASQFETTRILDRNGNVLYEILDPNAGRRTYVPLEKMSPYLVAATIATEDKEYYSHPGFDPMAILRAFLQNFRAGETVSGASTITQQLARILLFSPEERVQITYMRKVREALLAAEITRRYSKDEILELYMNEIYYGNLSYGVEAASETYFGSSADKLTLAQAAFLAGLPQAPSVYDVYTNREVTMNRFKQVLVLMYEASVEQGCIFVSNNQQPVCVDAPSAAGAYTELEGYVFKDPKIYMRYPHWVNYVRSLLEAQFDAQTIYRSGFTIVTTLDPGLQDEAERIVKEQVAALAGNNATDGALVAIRPSTGEILAMVGSADFYNEIIHGQVNMAISPRQPGSAIKPLTYVAAFEKGWTPATLIWDVPSEFPPSGDPNDPRPPYKPINYDERFHGPVTVRSALGNSYNVPAVKALQFVGIFDDPNIPGEDGLIALARRLGITTLNRLDYGLSLTLGGGEVSLLELTRAYAVLANSGRRIPSVAITRILDYSGSVLYDYQTPAGEQVVLPEHAFLIYSILSDNAARTLAFGANSVLNLPFLAAAKTGTTNDFRDNWTIGYTPDIAVGVWVGNADNTPMQNTTGLTGAAPIWAQFIQIAIQRLTGGYPTAYVRPAGIIERVICSVSGSEPSQWCPQQRSEYFASSQPPLPKGQDLWQRAVIDTWTGLLASPSCAEFTSEKIALNVSDPWAQKWIKEDASGQAWAESMGFSKPVFFTPDRACKDTDPRPLIWFAAPREGEVITINPVDIYGKASATGNFLRYRLEFGLGEDPVKWELLDKSGTPKDQPEKLYTWDLTELPAGPVTLRLYLESTNGTFAELRLHLVLQVPTPTPTPTDTPTETPTPTETSTSTPTETVTPTFTPTIKPTSSPTPSPTSTATPVPTPSPTNTSTSP